MILISSGAEGFVQFALDGPSFEARPLPRQPALDPRREWDSTSKDVRSSGTARPSPRASNPGGGSDRMISCPPPSMVASLAALEDTRRKRCWSLALYRAWHEMWAQEIQSTVRSRSPKSESDRFTVIRDDEWAGRRQGSPPSEYLDPREVGRDVGRWGCGGTSFLACQKSLMR